MTQIGFQRKILGNDGAGPFLKGTMLQRQRYDFESLTDQLVPNITLSVAKTGSDSNDGISAPVLTFAGLMKKIDRLDLSGKQVTISIGSGTWAETLLLANGSLGVTNKINIIGAGHTNTIINVNSNPGIVIRRLWDVTIRDLAVQSQSSDGIQLENARLSTFGTVKFATCGNIGFHITSGSQVSGQGNMIFTGQFGFCIYLSNGCEFDIADPTSINFTSVTASNSVLGVMYSSLVFYAQAHNFSSSSVTGRRLTMNGYSTLYTQGLGVNSVPGTVAASVENSLVI
jgi:hypothetical protein